MTPASSRSRPTCAGHRQCRLADLPDRGAGPGHPRQHPLRGLIGHRLLPADPPRAGRARAAPQRRSRAAHAGLPDPYPLSVGRIHAGDWPSSVPDRLVAEGRFGLRIDGGPAVARADLEAAVAEAAAHDPFLRDHPPGCRWPAGSSTAAAAGRAIAGEPGGRAAPPGDRPDHRAGRGVSRTAATCGSTPAPASRRCTTARAARARPTARTSRCRSRSCHHGRSCWKLLTSSGDASSTGSSSVDDVVSAS